MEELRRLQCEKAELKKENSFLKKAAAFFAKGIDSWHIVSLMSMSRSSDWDGAHCCQRIQTLYHDSHGVMGHRKMRVFLQREEISLSKTTVHKYMNRELQLHSICRRKRPAYHRGLAHIIFLNLLRRNFYPKQPNRVWRTDFTYMTLTNGIMRYNCSIIDLYDRSVVANENSSFITSSLVVRTLEKALSSAKAIPPNLILYSD